MESDVSPWQAAFGATHAQDITAQYLFFLTISHKPHTARFRHNNRADKSAGKFFLAIALFCVRGKCVRGQPDNGVVPPFPNGSPPCPCIEAACSGKEGCLAERIQSYTAQRGLPQAYGLGECRAWDENGTVVVQPASSWPADPHLWYQA